MPKDEILDAISVLRQLDTSRGNYGTPSNASDGTLIYVVPEAGIEFQLIGVRTGNEPGEIALLEAKVEDIFLFSGTEPFDVGVLFRQTPYLPVKQEWISTERPLELYVQVMGSHSLPPILNLVFLGKTRGEGQERIVREKRVGIFNLHEFKEWLRGYKRTTHSIILEPIDAFINGEENEEDGRLKKESKKEDKSTAVMTLMRKK